MQIVCHLMKHLIWLEYLLFFFYPLFISSGHEKPTGLRLGELKSRNQFIIHIFVPSAADLIAC